MSSILNTYLYNYNNENDVQKKFDLLGNIILLENDADDNHKTFVYKHIKTWFDLYLQVVQSKKFAYDEIIYEKVINKIELVKPSLRIHLINYLIRLLKKEFFVDEIIIYENYRKKQEILFLKEEKKYFSYLLKKATQSLKNVFITLIGSIVFFGLIWCLLENNFGFFSTTIVSFVGESCINHILNLLHFLFNQDEIQKIDSIFELIFFISIKLYFFLLISYFVIKEISMKVNSL